MKKIIINSNEFELTDSSCIFLQSYLNRTKRYIENNNLDLGLYGDIEDRISEKFFKYQENMGSISEKNVIDTINEIGESEDIFRDYEKKESKNGSFSHNMKKNFKKTLYKNPSEGIIFGVCQGLGEYFDINPVWFRVFFIASLFFFGTGVIVYILLAIILPDKNQEKTDIEENIKNAADKISKIASRPEIRETGIKIGETFGNFFQLVGRLISLILFLILGISLLGISIGVIIFGSILRAGFIFDNQNIFEYIPHYALYFFAAAGVIMLVLSIASIVSAFKKEGIISGKTFLWLIALFGISMFGIFSSAFETASNYTQVFSKTTNITLTGNSSLSGSEISVNLDSIRNMKGSFLQGATIFRFIKSPNADIHINVTDSIRAKNEQKGNEILNNLNQLKGTIKDSSLILSINSGSTFSSVVPYSFLQREIDIYIPENLTINLSQMRTFNFRIKDLKNIDRNGEVYKGYHCMDGILKYNERYREFVCYY